MKGIERKSSKTDGAVAGQRARTRRALYPEPFLSPQLKRHAPRAPKRTPKPTNIAQHCHTRVMSGVFVFSNCS